MGLIWYVYPKITGCRKLKKTDPAIIAIANHCAAQVRDVNSLKISNIFEKNDYWYVFYVVKQRKVSADGLYAELDLSDGLAVEIDRTTCEAKPMPRM
ncbi:MAG: hypothetical protein HY922_05705 [Elusimicrobia bacterium]|nr:hypothetical protein [Elusimicrobiota bacterium]